MIGAAVLQHIVETGTLTTPAYIYDLDGIEEGAKALVDALGHDNIVAYAVKANTAGSVVKRVARAGAGADVVSAGELQVALACGVPPARIVMSGVGKDTAEFDQAISAGIRGIQVESVEEIARLAARASALSHDANVSIRINPSVEIDSHSHIATGHDEAKFGVHLDDLDRAWAAIDAAPHLKAVGVSAHVGSMLTSPEPYVASAKVVCDSAKARRAMGKMLEFVDLGGGFGIDYGGQPAQPPTVFAKAALQLLAEQELADHQLVVEPGRSIVGPYGVLLTRVLQSKTSSPRRWAMIDAGMNDLLRPALYQAHHRVESLSAPPSGTPWRVVGPVCESSDDFGLHAISETLPDYVVIRDAGAYGFTLASEYNGRALAAEAFISKGQIESISASPGVDAWIKSRLDA